jgi:multiple sugar transport system substrate-binding protein
MKIRYAARKFQAFEYALNQQCQHFQVNYPGVEVEIDYYEVETLYKVITDPNHPYDAVMCSTDWLPEFIQKGRVIPLDDYLQTTVLTGWPDDFTLSLRRPQTDASGKTYGIAYHDGPEMFYYRKDLFESAEEQKKFKETYGYDLNVPQTWEVFIDVAKHFTRPQEGLFGTVFGAYPDGHNIVYDFILQLWSRGGDLLDDQMSPMFHSETGQEALQFLVDLIHQYKVVPPNIFELDSIRAGEYYYQIGKAAMTWNWSHIAACAEITDMSSIVGKNACTVIPRGSRKGSKHTSLISFYVNAISGNSENPAIAYRFIHAIAAPEMDKVTTFAGGIGTRLSTWRDNAVLAKFPFFSTIERIHEDVRSTPALVQWGVVNEILNRTIEQALRRNGNVSELLSRAAAEAEECLRKQ